MLEILTQLTDGIAPKTSTVTRSVQLLEYLCGVLRFYLINKMLFFFRYKNEKGFQRAAVTYRQKKLREQSKTLNMGRTASHLRFDDDGRPMNPTPSKALNKVKNFLDAATMEIDENKSESNQEELLDDNRIEDVTECNSVDKEKESEDGEDGVIDNEKDGDHMYCSEKKEKEDAFSRALMSSDSDFIDSSDEEIPWKTPSTNGNSGTTDSSAALMLSSTESGDIQGSVADSQGSGGGMQEAVEGGQDPREEVDDSQDAQTEEQVSGKNSSNKKRKKRRRRIPPMPEEISADQELHKYWNQRYRLFSKYDEGIKLDRGKESFNLYICTKNLI